MNERTISEREALIRDIRKLIQNQGIDPEELVTDVTVPISIFTRKLGCLESIVKYLHEHNELSFASIAKLTGRNGRAISASYRAAKKKVLGPLPVDHHATRIPVKILADRSLSVLEHIVLYLQQQGFTLADIARALKRDDRTVWTVQKRAEKKRKRNL